MIDFQLSKLLSLLSQPLFITLTIIWLCWFSLLLSGRRKTLIVFGIALISLTLAANPFFSSWAVQQLENQYPPTPIIDLPKADVIIALGDFVRAPRKPRIAIELSESSDRLLYATRLYHAGKANKIILSGGNVFKQSSGLPHADYAAQLLIDWGVKKSDILLENKSRTTYENAIYTKQLMLKTKLKHALLITSAMHMPRAMAIFKTLGVKTTAASTDFLIAAEDGPRYLQWMPSEKALHYFAAAIHEYIGYIIYWLRGYIH